MKAKTGFKYAGFGVLGVAAIFVFTWVVMLLWNALIPDLFKGPELAYWQTMGLLVLSKIIFSGIGGEVKGISPGMFASSVARKITLKAGGGRSMRKK